MKMATMPVLGIDGQIGPVGPVVAEHAVPEVITQAVIDLGRPRLLPPQLVHRLVRQVALAIQLAVVGQHQAIAEDVVRGGEEAAPGLGETTSPIAQRFGQEADAAPGVARLVLIRTIGTGEPGDLLLARPESGLRHPKRVEEELLQELLVRHAADDLDDPRGDIHALIAVRVPVAGLPLQWAGHRAQRASLQWSAVRPRDLLELGRVRQAAGVAEHVSDRDGPNRRF